MARNDDIDIIRVGLRANMPALAARFCPGGYVDGHSYWPINPARPGDRRPGSFQIDIYGGTAGRFMDYAAPEFKGDAIDFVALFEFGLMPPQGRRDAAVYKWIREFLSLPERERTPPKLAIAKPGTFGKDKRPDEAKAQGAFQWWLDADVLAPGSAGWTYLTEARSIPLAQLRRPPGAIRTLKTMKYKRPDAFDSEWPGLMTAMTDDQGRVRAVHRTFLAADGRGKAPVEKAKIMWPSTKGLSIRLSRGKTGRTPEDCARRGEREDRLVLLEGIEDGLCWSLMFPDDRVCAVGAVSLFKSAPIFDCAKEILIVADNDEIYSSGQLDHIASDMARRANGRDVFITRPLGDKDINDAFKRMRS